MHLSYAEKKNSRQGEGKDEGKKEAAVVNILLYEEGGVRREEK